ncbi:hypothetical protein EYF80_059942 [Liparis tanakae]|uniref:Uncharacterized protein n=1 Tax=Liparis tanakae TaxID=230148 RepID=A0A4Z2EMA1_9TELE|nr:hypothetical protein EYF80_059942 [Liparis tanakae]
MRMRRNDRANAWGGGAAAASHHIPVSPRNDGGRQRKEKKKKRGVPLSQSARRSGCSNGTSAFGHHQTPFSAITVGEMGGGRSVYFFIFLKDER